MVCTYKTITRKKNDRRAVADDYEPELKHHKARTNEISWIHVHRMTNEQYRGLIRYNVHDEAEGGYSVLSRL